jgi:hypothetical protein
MLTCVFGLKARLKRTSPLLGHFFDLALRLTGSMRVINVGLRSRGQGETERRPLLPPPLVGFSDLGLGGLSIR